MAACAETIDDRLDRVFHALAHRTRRALLQRLSKGAARITDLAAPFDMSLPAVSRHLSVLEDAGLLRRSINGRVHVCALEAAAMATVEEWLSAHGAFWDQQLDQLAGFVEDGQPEEE
jgi:DNA-binding transcriptional ArsR family regulator